MSQQASNVKSIFRQNALNNLNALQEIQGTLKVVEAKSVTYLIASVFALLGLVIWGFFGEVSMDVAGSGMILPLAQMENVERQLQEIERERFAILKGRKELLDKKLMLYKKHYLTIDDIDHARQEYFSAKEVMASAPKINRHSGDMFGADKAIDEAELDALVFVNHEDGKKIKSGMSVHVLPMGVSSYEYGYIKGRVISVSLYPATKELVYAYLGNMTLVDEFFNSGVPFAVKVKLAKSKETRSGLQWTSKNGVPYKISAGSFLAASIVYRQYHPYQLLNTHH